MGNLIPFSNPNDKHTKKEDAIVLKLMGESGITAKMRILPQEIHVLIRVLLKEQRETKELYHEAVAKKNKKEMDYWNMIQEVFHSLIKKLKGINKIEEVIQELSFVELDCLVGAMEQSIHETSLMELQLIEDDTPLVTEALNTMYQNIIPIYEEKRKEFESKQQQSE
ncbi:hypothetical protein CVD28_04015 [Bacillus sp. M6-12]|uniref:hypothetical protein n=1 Tax=Bacillus sp. M6-12 TaxID=2054166 RepID=UPI000C759488|nr:hypothetical protein [Bacillus sp. M6-12]PLS19591.1 hypothetical protein CVD28_04015 [Bacillus sp. M6-12]